jgi:hypothetical protein
MEDEQASYHLWLGDQKKMGYVPRVNLFQSELSEITYRYG